jgi:hypothetical protein
VFCNVFDIEMPVLLKLGVIIFGSVRFLSKKITKLNFFFLKKKPKPNRNRVKPTGFGSVRFFRKKPVQTGLARVFRFWLGFFPVSVRFGFSVIKPKPNRTGRVF